MSHQLQQQGEPCHEAPLLRRFPSSEGQGCESLFAEGQPKMIPPSVFETIALTLVFFIIVVGVTQKAITPIRLDHHHTSEVEVVADAAWLEVDGGDRDDFTVFQLV